MRALVIYGSSLGNTKTVVNRLADQLAFDIDLIEASNILDIKMVLAYELLLFFASTWGDGELQIDMENFFVRHRTDIDFDGKPYAICELGNYYGYDDFEFGALRIMQNQLNLLNGYELIEPFSLDSFPLKDWGNLTRWCESLNHKVGELQ
jgi:flavodoxin